MSYVIYILFYTAYHKVNLTKKREKGQAQGLTTLNEDPVSVPPSSGTRQPWLVLASRALAQAVSPPMSARQPMGVRDPGPHPRRAPPRARAA